jgi:hypothetical protein
VTGAVLCRLAAVAVAAALALAPLAQVQGPLLAPALLALLAEHVVVLLLGDGRVDAAAPLVGAGLLLYAELACWAQERRPAVRDEPEVTRARVAVLAVSAAGALGLGAAVLLAAGVPAGGGLTRLAVGVAAATLTLGLVATVARRTTTRPRS